MNIRDRIAAIVRAEYDKHPPDRYPQEQVIADAIVDQLGLQLSMGGQYVAYGVTLTDNELDRAGFTFHREAL